MSMTGNFEIDRHLNKVIQQLGRLEELQRELANLHGEGFAAEGLIRAEVGPTGTLIGLQIDPRAMRLGSSALSEAILEAAKTALTQVGEKAAELNSTFGEGFGDLAGALTRGVPQPGGVARSVTQDATAVGHSTDPVAEAINRLRGNIPR